MVVGFFTSGVFSNRETEGMRKLLLLVLTSTLLCLGNRPGFAEVHPLKNFEDTLAVKVEKGLYGPVGCPGTSSNSRIERC